MDYRDNRQRWAESHQVVHFYAGQWCTFTPALTSLSAGEAGLRLAGSILASESSFSRRVTSAGRESASFAVRRTSCVSSTAAFSLLRLLSSCHFREPARARESTSAQRNSSQRASAASARARCLSDARDPASTTHSYADMIGARMFAIACGYEDCDDLDVLRFDPAFKLACGRLPESGRDLMSQPTLSRLENAPSWRELVPRQHSSGGKDRLGRISKRGDGYIRRLLVHGARSVLRWRRAKPGTGPGWTDRLLARRPTNVVLVAMANKTARVAWALLRYERIYRPTPA